MENLNIKNEIFLIGNTTNNNKQEIVVKGTKVSTSNQQIRQLIKDYKAGKYINQGGYFATNKSNYVIFDYK